jgi:uncharacterized protein YheU (UPF0270 family)
MEISHNGVDAMDATVDAMNEIVNAIVLREGSDDVKSV